MKKILFIAALLAALFPRAAVSEENAGQRISKSFTVAKGGDLEVDVNGGDIRLVPWEKNEVAVVVDGMDPDDKDDLSMTQTGTTVRVEYRPKWGSSGDVRFTVSLPSQFNSMIHTSGGNLTVDGKLIGKLDGSTSGGDIQTGAIDGPTILKTSGGNITLGKISGETDVKTSGGDITIEGVGKRVKASTSGGTVQVGDVGGQADLSSSGGDIRVGNVSGNASLRTSGGNIELVSATGRVDLKTAGGNVELTNVSGSVDARTAGGNLFLKKITGSVDAKTAGGNVDAELIPHGGTRSSLATAAGDVHLAIPADAKVTIDATIRLQGFGRRHNNRDRSNFTISSDFEASVSDGAGQSEDAQQDIIHKVYKVNGGGDAITLSTSNGNISIKKMSK
jgi:DUF4097 and DUF4098 domain-containing protein YvlB